MAEFKEFEHPRAKDGKFTTKGNKGKKSSFDKTDEDDIWEAFDKGERVMIYEEIILALIKDEQEAVAGYEDAMSKITDTHTLEVLKHITDEELEHIKELNELLVQTSNSPLDLQK